MPYVCRKHHRFNYLEMNAPKLVQSGFAIVLTGLFDFPTGLFHTLFNKTVEKFHQPFTIIAVLELRWRANCNEIRANDGASGLILARRVTIIQPPKFSCEMKQLILNADDFLA